LAARILQVNGKYYLSPGILQFSMESAEILLGVLQKTSKRAQRKVRKVAKNLGMDEAVGAKFLEDAVMGESAPLFTRFWLHEALASARLPGPQICNFDGDELVFCEVRFPVPDANVAEVERRLDGAAELERHDEDDRRWQWVGDKGAAKKTAAAGARGKNLSFGSFDDRGRLSLGMVELRNRQIHLSANSRERAERGGQLLTGLLGGLVGPSLTNIQDLDSQLDDDDHPEDSAADQIPPELAAQIIHEHLDQHYRQCISDKIPMLDDKTPRQAARTKSGRAKLVQWLKCIENGETRRARGQDQEPYDLGWMWKELGVSELRE
jgi:hypothetical protein